MESTGKKPLGQVRDALDLNVTQILQEEQMALACFRHHRPAVEYTKPEGDASAII
jgi:hypothetical protein